MRSLFYCVVLLHLIFWVSCIGSPRSREGNAPDCRELILRLFRATDFDFEGNWR